MKPDALNPLRAALQDLHRAILSHGVVLYFDRDDRCMKEVAPPPVDFSEGPKEGACRILP